MCKIWCKYKTNQTNYNSTRYANHKNHLEKFLVIKSCYKVYNKVYKVYDTIQVVFETQNR
jgi:hypothetical protein